MDVDSRFIKTDIWQSGLMHRTTNPKIVMVSKVRILKSPHAPWIGAD